MKRSRPLSVLLCLAFAVMLISGGLLFPSAAQAKTVALPCHALAKMAEHWFYVPATVPDMLEVVDCSEPASFDYNNRTEFGKTCEITFVSGDESLKDALKSRTYTAVGGDDTAPAMDLYVDNEQLKAPGTAVFHVRVISAHCVDEADVTLCVLAWEDDPLLVVHEAPLAVQAQPGDILEGQLIASSIMELRDQSIVDEFRDRGTVFHLGSCDSHLHHSSLDKSGVIDEWDNTEELLRTRDPLPYKNGYRVGNYGSADVEISYDRGNIRFSGIVPIVAASYRLNGPKAVRPGETVRYEILDELPSKNRTFTVSCEGENVAFDPDKLTLTASENAAEGTPFTLTLSPSDGGETAVLQGMVTSALLTAETFELIPFRDGFKVPVLANKALYQYGINQRGVLWSAMKNDPGPYHLEISCQGDDLDEFAEDPAVAKALYEGMTLSGLTVDAEEIIEISGHPAKLMLGSSDGLSAGSIDYIRNNRTIRVMVRIFAVLGSDPEEIPRVSRADMMALADRIAYNPSDADIVVSDGLITISTKNSDTVLCGGRKIIFSAAFAKPDKVNWKAKNDLIEWSVTDTATGEEPADITIDEKGTFSVPVTLAEVRHVEVRASSPVFHTSAVYPITLIPALTKLSVDPTELTFYLGTTVPQTVKAVLEPATVPPVGLTWTPAWKGIIDLTEVEPGTIAVKPLTTGRTSIVVRESSGKSAKVNVNVVIPVEKIDLTVTGKPVPGGYASVSAAVAPRNAADRTVEWSLDVSDSIATVNKGGSVRISRDAPVGTVITVTCKAPGAPEPVVASVQIKVEAK